MGCLFHKWDGCVCSKCGKKRNAGHQYVWKPTARYEKNIQGGLRFGDIRAEGCQQVCTKCGTSNPASFREHDYQKKLCTPVCTRCGNKGRSEHEYEDVDGRCVRRCRVCGAEMEIPHITRGRVRDGKCEQFCTRCGMILSGHDWNKVDFFDEKRHNWQKRDGCKCRTCGAVNPNGLHQWKRIEEGGFANIKECKNCGARDESEKITLEEAEKRAREQEEAMIRADQLHEMRAAGFKC